MYLPVNLNPPVHGYNALALSILLQPGDNRFQPFLYNNFTNLYFMNDWSDFDFTDNQWMFDGNWSYFSYTNDQSMHDDSIIHHVEVPVPKKVLFDLNIERN